MIKVHIWDYVGKDQSWGHASMYVNQRYISWWPQSKGRNPYKTSSILSTLNRGANNLYLVLPIANRSFNDDVKGENNHQPNSTIIINGLDETKIIFWWNHFALSYGGTNEQGPIYSSWSTLDMNCSTVVANALKEGGGDKYSDFWKAHNYIWKPNDVKRFAESIVLGLHKNKST